MGIDQRQMGPMKDYYPVLGSMRPHSVGSIGPCSVGSIGPHSVGIIGPRSVGSVGPTFCKGFWESQNYLCFVNWLLYFYEALINLYSIPK